MAGTFDYFIILAGMRTGSNFLETSLNQLADVEVFGEAFNPVFVGHQKQKDLLGFDLKTRERAPLKLIKTFSRIDNAIAGFRFFHDHDPRVLEHCLADHRCAKIVLSRDPLDSFVSLQIARKTGQWKLTDGKSRKFAKIPFIAEEYDAFCTERDAFQDKIQSALQRSGQTAFQITYGDLADVDVLNGIALFLGSKEKMNAPSRTLKRQNPTELRDKIINYDEMRTVLNRARAPDETQFDPEQKRGPGVPSYFVSDALKVIFAPLKSGPTASVVAGLETAGEVRTGLTQTELRGWKRDNAGHRSFTVLRHPLPRIYQVYMTYFLKAHPDFQDLKSRLFDHYKVKFPAFEAGNQDAIRDGFESFLKFLKANLADDTSVAIDPIWASQTVLLDGISNVLHPDFILREDALEDGLRALGVVDLKAHDDALNAPVPLSEIYSERTEKLCRSAYRKDYINFGFTDWA